MTLKLVDWADEEGARFGRSLVGSAAAGGSTHIERLRTPRRSRGRQHPDALEENGVDIETMLNGTSSGS